MKNQDRRVVYTAPCISSACLQMRNKISNASKGGGMGGTGGGFSFDEEEESEEEQN